METDPASRQLRQAIRLVVLLGLVSLLADVTYEGARSVVGPYFQVLGASAAVVGVVAGLGELVGYVLRLGSGYLADRTRRYWMLTLMGYAINLLAVPALALTSRWEVAAALVVLERTGKALRTPARDAILSHATARIGRGWGFGLHEAMDQIGAILGPMVVAGILLAGGSFRTSFAALGIPAILALLVLAVACALYPRPQELESKAPDLRIRGFSASFWLYMIGAACVAAGFVDFPLIAYHFEKVRLLPAGWIPISYALAMAVDAVAALIFGRLFDRIGFLAVAIGVLASALFAPLVFLKGTVGAAVGLALWGIGMGAQESIIRAAVGAMVPSEWRGRAYGIFNAGYGLAWFAGSACMGVLYGFSLPVLVAFSVGAQLASLPFFLLVIRTVRKESS
ncbi:Permease of the major facilitator superfamily [Thermogutta terrifontis]|uniref:Permease of the major facilitator superfamily n=1 Tax=Thermogutta terrifontis TaxID=1331910 RepID=A0A286RB94_9BACT|nr:MFS transporter [Thermogutta terrifontis]ASV73231.1 Permease of the major facilitator superfamily [Thermogutta terrifontis]